MTIVAMAQLKAYLRKPPDPHQLLGTYTHDANAPATQHHTNAPGHMRGWLWDAGQGLRWAWAASGSNGPPVGCTQHTYLQRGSSLENLQLPAVPMSSSKMHHTHHTPMRRRSTGAARLLGLPPRHI